MKVGKISEIISSSPLPVKNGVSPNKLWLPCGEWPTYLSFFVERFPHILSDDFIQRFRNNEMVLSSGQVLTENCRYQSGKHVYFYREIKDEPAIPFYESILFENDRFMVVDKPHFLPVAPSGSYLTETVLTRLRVKTKCDELELCHRLDRETAGVLLLTKRAKYRDGYHQLFADKKIIKIYNAITNYKELDYPLHRKSLMKREKNSIRMVESDGEPNSKTIVRLVQVEQNEQLLELQPVTGKKHQLRVHLASLGMPIKNDSLYPKANYKAEGDFSSPLQLLAKSIAFIDPYDGSQCFYQSNQQLQLIK